MTQEPITSIEQCPVCSEAIEPEAAACVACGEVLFTGRFDDRLKGPRPPQSIEYDDLVPIEGGSLSEMMALQAALGAKGFETFLNDQETKVIDPFITGGYCLGSTLVAHKHDAEAVKEVLARDEELRRTDPLVEEREPTPEEVQDHGMRDLARRTGWCAVTGILGPVGLVFATLYFLEMRKTGRKAGLSLMVFAVVFCVVQTVMLYWLVFGHGIFDAIGR